MIGPCLQRLAQMVGRATKIARAILYVGFGREMVQMGRRRRQSKSGVDVAASLFVLAAGEAEFGQPSRGFFGNIGLQFAETRQSAQITRCIAIAAETLMPSSQNQKMIREIERPAH